MMHVYANLAWPDDPYRASQQLYRRPSAMLAAFAVAPRGRPACRAPAATAVVYLPLPRNRVVTVTEDTVPFGFRATSILDDDRIPELVASADLDLMQARRHARFLAGDCLAANVRALREAMPSLAARGLAGVEADLADCQARVGVATIIIDVRDGSGLVAACRSASITSSAYTMAYGVARQAGAEEAETLAAAAAEEGLAIALACAQQLGRYRWHGNLRTARIMAAAAWDLFPQVLWDDTPCEHGLATRYEGP